MASAPAMYGAGFELAGRRWRVHAGTVTADGAGVPRELLAALAEGDLLHLGVRRCYNPDAARTEVLVPVAAEGGGQGGAPPMLQQLATIAWCASPDEFDACMARLGPARCWLDAPSLQHAGIPFAAEAGWLTDAAWFDRLSAQVSFVHQVNIAFRPSDGQERRELLKHLLRLDAAVAEGRWPAARAQGQRRRVQQRLDSPWVIDEVLACADAATLQQICARLVHRLREQAGPRLADEVLQAGDFDEMLHTGLDSATLLDPEGLARVSHAAALAQVWGHAATGRGEQGMAPKAYDIFLSHATPDAALALELCSRLEGQGLRCWIAPRNIAAGSHYAEAIEQAVLQSRGLVLLLSEAGLRSTHVLRELERAVHYRATVLPVRLSSLEPRGAFGYLLSGCQWTDAIAGVDGAALAARLIDGLGGRG